MSDQELERVKQILVGDLRDALQSIEARFEHEAFLALVTDVVAEALEQRTDNRSGHYRFNQPGPKEAGILAVSNHGSRDPKINFGNTPTNDGEL